MSTCKTSEKEMLLPHIFRGARDVKVTKGGADPKQKTKNNKTKKSINKHNSHFEMTQRIKTKR